MIKQIGYMPSFSFSFSIKLAAREDLEVLFMNMNVECYTGHDIIYKWDSIFLYDYSNDWPLVYICS